MDAGDVVGDDFFSMEHYPGDSTGRGRPEKRRVRPSRSVVLRQRRRRRRFIVAVTGLLSVLVALTGSGYSVVRTRLDQIVRLPVPGLVPPNAGQAINTLVVATDAGEAQQVALVKTAVGGGPASVVMVPPWLGLPTSSDPVITPETGPSGAAVLEKVGVAFARGGPPELVTLVSQGFGTELHHYAEVSVEGFGTMVDVVGGVLVSEPGGSGCQLLNGPAAMDLLRVSSPEDPSVQEKRADFLAGFLAETLRTRWSDPGPLLSLLGAGAAEVILDDTWTSRDLTAMGTALAAAETDLRSLAPSVDPAEVAADVLAGAADVKVRVLNGVRVDGAAARAGTALKAAGFTVTGQASAGYPAFATTVSYGPGQRNKAEFLVARLTTAQVGSEDPRLSDADVVLVVGEDYAGLYDGPPRPVVPPAEDPSPPASLVRRTCG